MGKQKGIRDSMLHTVDDRRQLNYVPDPTHQRSGDDRRRYREAGADLGRLDALKCPTQIRNFATYKDV